MTMKFDTWCKQCAHQTITQNHLLCSQCEFNDANMPSRFLAKKLKDVYTYTDSKDDMEFYRRLADINEKPSQGEYARLALEIGKLVDQKQKAYGDSFSKAEEFLKLLYPHGIRKHQYKDLLTIVRIFEKLMRIATDKDALGESPFGDIAGYALLGLMADKHSPDPTATKENYLKEKGNEKVDND
jgi:hypothetical protein